MDINGFPTPQRIKVDNNKGKLQSFPSDLLQIQPLQAQIENAALLKINAHFLISLGGGKGSVKKHIELLLLNSYHHNPKRTLSKLFA